MNRLKITNKEIRSVIGKPSPTFEKYVAPLINLANRYARATIPAKVGQMSDLIQQFSGSTVEEWEKWYTSQYPDSIEKATEEIWEMLQKFKKAMENDISKSVVESWVKDLLIYKTFMGLKFQEAILSKVAEDLKDILDQHETPEESSFRLAIPEEEAKGIDGFIRGIGVSIKPDTYKAEKGRLQEDINFPIIYYEKKNNGIVVDFSELIKVIQSLPKRAA